MINIIKEHFFKTMLGTTSVTVSWYAHIISKINPYIGEIALIFGCIGAVLTVISVGIDIIRKWNK